MICSIVRQQNTLAVEGIPMKLVRKLVIAGLTSALCSNVAYAADYYVSPQVAGAVSGTPLAAISLRGQRIRSNVTTTTRKSERWKSSPRVTTTTTTEPTTTVTEEPVVTTSPEPSVAEVDEPVVSTVNDDEETASPSPTPTPTSSPTPTTSGSTTYASLADLVNSGVLVPGDRVFLKGGRHGLLRVNGMNFTAPVTISGAPGEVAQVEGIEVAYSSNVIIQDLKVWRSDPSVTTMTMVRGYSNASDITFTNLDIRAAADSPDYLSWNFAKWDSNKRNGVSIEGPRMSVIGNRVTGVYFGISASGPYALIENNIIDGFSGDGMRALGDNSIIRGNKVQNCFIIDTNHPDGFQSWSRNASGQAGAGTLYNLRIENNKIYEWNHSVSNPLQCGLQGIGMFNGMFENVTITNNVISVSSYHGISVYGAKNLVISQNTVATKSSSRQGLPWIMVGWNGFDGKAPVNVMVANNIANSYDVPESSTNNVHAINNTTVTNAATEFVSPTTNDFTLLPTAKAANT
ncbi:MAG: right-handed parallel beta-helix repeat-containing protein, partial [Pseudorhodobacter sp.]